MKILVTGGGGFLGSGISRCLIAKGHQVKILSRGEYSLLGSLGIEVLRGDIADEKAVFDVTRNCDAVFHTAAKAGIWGKYKEYYKTNVIGTKNIINACMKNKVSRLVFTSSPSVVFHGSNQEGENEDVPYPDKYLAHYPKTKAIAEELVLKANSNILATIALRPHLIWGPGDNHLIPRIIERAKAGKLRIIGNGKNLVDSIYIDNAVDAHIVALERLFPNSPISGKAYFITNDEPLPIKEIINKILEAGNLAPVNKRIPAKLAYFAGALMELSYSLIGKKDEPIMTRFLALELSRAHWFDIKAAKRDLGYEPIISIDEGMKKLKNWLKNSAKS